MLRPDTFALTALLALITALGPVSTDMYLPSLPDIGRLLSASAAEVQLTLSAYLIGFAVGQIAYGPFSDRHGRKPVLLAALTLFSLGNVACTFAPSIEMLIAARTLQALGGSGAIVVARAIVRDLYAGARAGRELSLMGAIMALAPVGAPMIGGVLQSAFGWRVGTFRVSGNLRSRARCGPGRRPCHSCDDSRSRCRRFMQNAQKKRRRKLRASGLETTP